MAEETTAIAPPYSDELWLDIVGYEGLYQVSNKGRVKSISRIVFVCDYKKTIRERILKPNYSHGYEHVFLRKNGTTRRMSVHSLVAIAFLGKPGPKMEVNHKNAIRNDNRVENLEWCTRKYNIWYAYNVIGMKRYNSIPVKCIENNTIYPSIRKAGRELNVSDTLIAKVLSGGIEMAKGLRFIKVTTN